jgi:DNA-binding HxlR family transcriptional regulator
MEEPHRSGCPINLTLEVLGDRWSLIVIRDVMFGNRRRYRELLTRSEEGIASNVLRRIGSTLSRRSGRLLTDRFRKKSAESCPSFR